MRNLLLLALFLVAAGWLLSRDGFTSYGPGVLAPDAPLQQAVRGAPGGLAREGYAITALATFKGKARVLAREDYWLGRETELSPTDLVLGWGPMSDESVLADVSISQRNRFYFWHVDAFPIPRREIERNSANMHFIPADAAVADALERVGPGDLIEFDGYLVEVRGEDGWHWRSSTSRNDTGNGACELILLHDLRIL
jgi:hypothetical protein